MKLRLILMLAMLAGSVGSSQMPKTDSKPPSAGSDKPSKTLAVPAAGGTAGSKATPEQARDSVVPKSKSKIVWDGPAPTVDDVRPYLHSHDNFIEYNEIHNGMETMGDGNGIYIRGAGAGNMIRRNYIHHLVNPILMQAAIRTDGGQRDTLIAENLIYTCMAQGII
jgi:hypothetical protein